LTLLVLRALIRLRLVIQTSVIYAKVPEVQEDSILADGRKEGRKKEVRKESGEN